MKDAFANSRQDMTILFCILSALTCCTTLDCNNTSSPERFYCQPLLYRVKVSIKLTCYSHFYLDATYMLLDGIELL